MSWRCERARTADPSGGSGTRTRSGIDLQNSYGLPYPQHATATSYDQVEVSVPMGLPVEPPVQRRLSRDPTNVRYPPPPPPPRERRPFPWFCLMAIAANTAVFVLEVYANNWELQPFSCPRACAGGMPCFENGSPCEANPLLGPTVQVLNQLGAKNDAAIFERGEWWRLLSCNWLHAGIIHAALNMAAIWTVGGELERAFGFWKVGLLYIFAGVFGTVVSIVFLPGTLSVGASASVFGLLGANWADVTVNFIARCTLKGSGIGCLLIATVINVSFGFTPYVDNFMHLGGMLAGLVIGLAVFAQKTHRDASSGRRVHTWGQELVVLLATLTLIGLAAGGVAAMLSNDVQDLLRQCPFCEHLNCIPMPFWSCCSMALRGSCLSIAPPASASDPIVAVCNMTNAAEPYTAQCSPADDDACVYEPDLGPTDPRLGALCAHICSGCAA